jgi:hypothetical protein
MSDRFKVIDGGQSCERPSGELTNVYSGKPVKFEAHVCQRCTDDLGFPFDRLVIMRVGSMVSMGRIEGGHDYFCCPRCMQAYYRVDP